MVYIFNLSTSFSYKYKTCTPVFRYEVMGEKRQVQEEYMKVPYVSIVFLLKFGNGTIF